MEQPKPTILCVDDEENPLILRKLVLEKAGYNVITANSAIQALALLACNEIDLVLSDQLMPGITGTQLAREVKGLQPTLPVVLISGVNEIPPDAQYADLFISKVEGPVRLCQSLSEILRASNPA